ncbi:MAG: hypothetical protein RDV48_29385 [Candidatus Eremiobacteraeota bacterium]|nr:hypothetical protein [Candidatus Eremiobacteraeota bacterium]
MIDMIGGTILEMSRGALNAMGKPSAGPAKAAGDGEKPGATDREDLSSEALAEGEEEGAPIGNILKNIFGLNYEEPGKGSPEDGVKGRAYFAMMVNSLLYVPFLRFT